MWSQRETLLRFFSELFNHSHLICLRFEVYLFYGFALIKHLPVLSPSCLNLFVLSVWDKKKTPQLEEAPSVPSPLHQQHSPFVTSTRPVFRQIVSLWQNRQPHASAYFSLQFLLSSWYNAEFRMDSLEITVSELLQWKQRRQMQNDENGWKVLIVCLTNGCAPLRCVCHVTTPCDFLV